MLPGADGWDVCRHLRARHADVPVIMLSARSAEAHRVLGLELGADDYLAKPFSMLELVARVRALLRRIEQLRSPPAATPQLRFGPLPARHACGASCVRGDTRVPLTLREFDLLHFLARAPGPRVQPRRAAATGSGATASTATSTPSTRTSTGCAEDRGRPARAALDRDRLGRGLPLRCRRSRAAMSVDVRGSFTARLSLALAVLLLAYGAFVALLGRQVAAEHEQEVAAAPVARAGAAHRRALARDRRQPDRDEAERRRARRCCRC